MSQENVELVLAFQPHPDMDLVEHFRDDDSWAEFSAALAPAFAPDFESANALLGIEKTYTGMGGFRNLWLDWLAPWATQRVEIDQAIDLGDQGLMIDKALATVEGSTAQVKRTAAALWTLRHAKVTRVEFYPDQGEALKAVGLAE